jgi:hypothetical protein
MSRGMSTVPIFRNKSLVALALLASTSGCTESNPTALIPPGDRVLIQQEAARESGQGSVSVNEILARARGDKVQQPIVLHIVDTAGALSLPQDDLNLLASIDQAQHVAVLRIGPSDDPSPVRAALDAPRRAKFLAQYLPQALHLAETRYDVSLALNTARLEFGEAEGAH